MKDFECCNKNQMQLDIGKTKEMVTDFRRSKSLLSYVTIDGKDVEVVGSTGT